MQLKWLAATVAVCAVSFSSPALGQTIDDRRASASFRVYTDNDHMTVVSPSAGAQAPVTETLGVDANVTADIISGASVDVISEASPTAISETRIEGGVGVSWRSHRLATLRARTTFSHEPDFESLRLSIGANVELAKRNTTVDVLYVAGADSIGTTVDPTFDKSRRVHQLTATLTQAVDERTYVDIVGEGRRASGYHANPYRTVPIIDATSPTFMRVEEVTPRLRHAGALQARVRRAIDARARVVAHLSYRLYQDSWSVRSHTGTLTTIGQFTKRVRLGLTMRGYTQSAADFFRSNYVLDGGMAPALRTRERRLGRMRSLFGGATADVALSERIDQGPRIVIAGSLMRFWWPDFPAQSERTALSLTVAASAVF